MLIRFIRDIFKSNFARSVALITGGTAVAQLLNGLFYPVITRLYSPGEFGVFTLFMAVVGILAIIGGLRYENSIPIADDDEKAINSFALSIFVLISLSLLLSLVFFLFGERLFNFFNAPILSDYRYFISLGFFLTALTNVLMQWAFRKKNYKGISKTKVSRSTSMNITQIGFGFLKTGPLGLLSGKIFSEISGSATLGFYLIKRDRHLFSKISLKKIKWVARRYIKFAIYSVPSQLFSKSSIELPVFFITSLYGSTIVGLYGLAHLIVNLPVMLIGNSVGDVFYAEAASIGRKDPARIKDLSQTLIKRLILIGIAPTIILLFFGPFIFGFVFGSEWYEAGVYARIISVLVFVRFIVTPLVRIFYVYEKQKTALFLSSVRVFLVCVVFIAAWLLELSSHMAVLLYCLVMILIYLLYYIFSQRVINNYFKSKLNK